jgi:hypothetical protein
MRSDHGANFEGAAGALELEFASINHHRVANDLMELGVEWRFIPPRTPHVGGVWERMVQTVKRTLYKSLDVSGEVFPETFRTFCCIVEGLVNDRPLQGTSSDDPNEIGALRPSDFLHPERVVFALCWDTKLRPGRRTAAHGHSNHPRQRHWTMPFSTINRQAHDQLVQMRKSFWFRWRNEYVNSLQKLTRWEQGDEPNIKVGDVVMQRRPPAQWNLARVVALRTGADKRVRIVRICRVKPTGSKEVVDAHVGDLCVLEGVLDEHTEAGWPPPYLLQHPRANDPLSRYFVADQQRVARRSEAVPNTAHPWAWKRPDQ